MALPCALFSSSAKNHKPEEFINQILKVSDLPKPHNLNDDIQGYEWAFETKYYTTTIHLCTTEARTIGSQEFADNLQAFIHVFDPNEPESFELTKAWLPYLEHIEPTIQILVCDTSKHTDVIDRKKILEWCISHSFELVELSPEQDIDDDDEEEDDFAETTGLARIVQALHAHTWPNLQLKDSPTVQSPYVRQLMKEQHLLNQQEASLSSSEKTDNHSLTKEKDNISENSKALSSALVEEDKSGSLSNGVDQTASSKGEQDAFDLDNLDKVDWNSFLGADIQNKDGGDVADPELGVEEFEQLFQRLRVMKDKAENLPLEERKKYAEKVAVSFWKAIGGDEDEIAGVDSDSN